MQLGGFTAGLMVVLAVASAGLTKAADPSGVETLLVIEPTKEHPRLSEGDIVELKDGRLCLVYSQFRKGGTDFDPADLVMRTSSDDGKTWSEPKVLVSGEEADMKNVMSASILRLPGNELLLFYLRLNSRSSDHMYVRRSADEFMTLSDPVRVTLLDGYHVVNNDRVIRLSTGRLVVPVTLHTELDHNGKLVGSYQSLGAPFVYYSDDDGRTWKKDRTLLKSIAQRKLAPALQEAGVIELKDGRLWMWMRAWADFQYGCYSNDGGKTWSEPEPTSIASPLSPATIERVPWTGDLLCVWNDHSGLHPYPKEKPRNKRTPLCVAVSKDEGRTWAPSRAIETNLNGWFCYSSMTFHKDRAILAYMQRDESVTKMLGLKVVALSRGWLYAEPVKQP
jgi:sialidase-1